MRITCPTCAAAYEVGDDAIGAGGRKVRCRACGASWHQPSANSADTVAAPIGALRPSEPTAPIAIAGQPLPATEETLAPDAAAAPVAALPIEPPAPKRRGLRALLIALALVVAALLLGGAVATMVFGTDRMASELGLADTHVPLGISITRQPDWRMIAGGSALFAVSGHIWNPTRQIQPVPDIKAELKDKSGRTVYRWTITRPVARLAPGQGVDFDGAAVDVPRSSANVAVTFAGASGD